MVHSSKWLSVSAIALAAGAWYAGYDVWISIGLLSAALLIWVFRFSPLGGADLVQDKISLASYNDPTAYAYAIKYHNPGSFKTFSVVYDPVSVAFDSYSIQVEYRNYSNSMIPKGKQTGKGEVLAQDPTKKAIIVLSDYTQPSITDKHYIFNITVQFFLNKRTNAEQQKTLLTKFDLVRSQVEFRKYKTLSSYELIPRTGSEWNRKAF